MGLFNENCENQHWISGILTDNMYSRKFVLQIDIRKRQREYQAVSGCDSDFSLTIMNSRNCNDIRTSYNNVFGRKDRCPMKKRILNVVNSLLQPLGAKIVRRVAIGENSNLSMSSMI